MKRMFLFFGLFLLTQNAWAQSSELPLPRFASLRFNQVNLRTGPGMRYPVDWVYLKQDLPVEIVSEFEHWRKIKDFEGKSGWVHRHMLSGRRTVRTLNEGVLRRAASEDSLALARYEKGVIGKVSVCSEKAALCQVDFQGFQGWTLKSNLWGVYPDEVLE